MSEFFTSAEDSKKANMVEDALDSNLDKLVKTLNASMQEAEKDKDPEQQGKIERSVEIDIINSENSAGDKIIQSKVMVISYQVSPIDGEKIEISREVTEVENGNNSKKDQDRDSKKESEHEEIKSEDQENTITTDAEKSQNNKEAKPTLKNTNQTKSVSAEKPNSIVSNSSGLFNALKDLALNRTTSVKTVINFVDKEQKGKIGRYAEIKIIEVSVDNETGDIIENKASEKEIFCCEVVEKNEIQNPQDKEQEKLEGCINEKHRKSLKDVISTLGKNTQRNEASATSLPDANTNQIQR